MANLPAEVARLAVSADGTPRPEVLEWLKTSASFEDVADMLEVLEVHASWGSAKRHNSDLHTAAKKASNR